MIKIAHFSDVHANLPAFNAFLADLDSREVDAVYCLGDLVGYNVWPNEVINAVCSRGIPTICGNHDIKVKKLDSCSDLSSSGKDYAYHIIGQEERGYLNALPAYIRLSIGDSKLLLVHGSPASVNEYLTEHLDETYLKSVLLDADATILCFGHTHIPYHRIINTGTAAAPDLRHLINTGSAGKPKDGNPQGCYVILTIREDLSKGQDRNQIKVEFVRFNYNIEEAAKAIENSPLPDSFADCLRKAE